MNETIFSYYSFLYNKNHSFLESGGRRRRIVGLVSIGAEIVSGLRNVFTETIKPEDSFGKRVLDASSKGLGLFSAGMAVVSIIPNPVTPGTAAISGALSLGLEIARDNID